MHREHDAKVLAAIGAHPRPATLLYVNLKNFKAFNVAAGAERGDTLLATLERFLRESGWTQRTAGDEFATVVVAPLSEARARARRVAWLCHSVVNVTDFWRIRLRDGRALPSIPWQHAQIVCWPRIAMVECTSDALTDLTRAREQCITMWNEPAPPDFPPRQPHPFNDRVTLADESCPVCGFESPLHVARDLGWSGERCPKCEAEYEREHFQSVLGAVTQTSG